MLLFIHAGSVFRAVYILCAFAAFIHLPGHAPSPHIAVYSFQRFHVVFTQYKVKQLKIQRSVDMLGDLLSRFSALSHRALFNNNSTSVTIRPQTIVG